MTPIQVSNEEELIKSLVNHFQLMLNMNIGMSAASFLSYGGVLKVVRADDAHT